MPFHIISVQVQSKRIINMQCFGYTHKYMYKNTHTHNHSEDEEEITVFFCHYIVRIRLSLHLYLSVSISICLFLSFSFVPLWKKIWKGTRRQKVIKALEVIIFYQMLFWLDESPRMRSKHQQI